jgi:hypothetical protein
MIPPTKKRLRSECHSQRSQICTDVDLLRAHLTILRGQNVRLDVALAAFRDVIPELLRKISFLSCYARYAGTSRETEFFKRREAAPATDIWVDEQFEDSNA